MDKIRKEIVERISETSLMKAKELLEEINTDNRENDFYHKSARDVKKSNGRLKSLMACPFIGCLFFDVDGKILQANETIANLVSYPLEVLETLNIQKIISRSNYEQIQRAVNQAKQKENFEPEIVRDVFLVGDCGEKVKVDISFCKSDEEEELLTCAVVTDVTQ